MQTRKSPTGFMRLLLAAALIVLLTPAQAAAEAGGSGDAGATAPAPGQASTAPAGGGFPGGQPGPPGGMPGGMPPGMMGGPPGPSGGGHPGGMPGGMMGGMPPGMMGGPPGPPVVEQHNVRPQFQTLAIAGMGVAIPASNPSDVHIVRVGIATVHIMVLDEAQDVTVGMLIYDDTRFSLKEVTLGPERIGAAIYQKDQKAGTLTLASTRRAGFEVWSGEVALNSTRLNTYILQPPRPPTPDEYGEGARRFCESNPSGCQGIAPSACDPAQPGCRAEIERYCATNSREIRCVALQKGHCANNSQDVRCRSAGVPPGVALQLDAFCKQRPEACSGLGTTREEVINTCSSPRSDNRCYELFRTYCAAYPNDAGCAGMQGGGHGPPSAPGAPGREFAPPGQGPGGPGQGFGAPGQAPGGPGRGPGGQGAGVPGQEFGGQGRGPSGQENRNDRAP